MAEVVDVSKEMSPEETTVYNLVRQWLDSRPLVKHLVDSRILRLRSSSDQVRLSMTLEGKVCGYVSHVDTVLLGMYRSPLEYMSMSLDRSFTMLMLKAQ